MKRDQDNLRKKSVISSNVPDSFSTSWLRLLFTFTRRLESSTETSNLTTSFLIAQNVKPNKAILLCQEEKQVKIRDFLIVRERPVLLLPSARLLRKGAIFLSRLISGLSECAFTHILQQSFPSTAIVNSKYKSTQDLKTQKYPIISAHSSRILSPNCWTKILRRDQVRQKYCRILGSTQSSAVNKSSQKLNKLKKIKNDLNI